MARWSRIHAIFGPLWAFCGGGVRWAAAPALTPAQALCGERELGDGECAEAEGAALQVAAARVHEELDERDENSERETHEQRDEDAADVLNRELVGVLLAVLGVRAVVRVACPPALLEFNEFLRETLSGRRWFILLYSIDVRLVTGE